MSKRRFQTLPRRLAASIEAESGLNDAPAILLVAAIAAQLTGGSEHPWWLIGLEVVAELVGGSAIGVAIGFAGAELLRRVALPLAGFYPLAKNAEWERSAAIVRNLDSMRAKIRTLEKTIRNLTEQK